MSGTDAEIAAYGLSFLIELVKKRPRVFLVLFALAGFAVCALMFAVSLGLVAGSGAQDEVLSDEPTAAEITFISLSDMKDWIDDATDLRWGLAISKKDLTRIIEKNGKMYNEPVMSIEYFDRYVVASDIRTGEEVHIKIKPGTYDWLIVIDEDNDGSWDSYLGSIEQDIKMNEMGFAASERFEVVVGVDSIPRLTRSKDD